MNDELKILSLWFNENKLALNVSKTKFMIFLLRHQKPPDNFRIILDGIELEHVSSTKFLGVILDEKLTWNDHIHHVATKLSGITGVLARLKYQIPPYIMKTIYSGLFGSILQYGISVWGGVSNKQSNRLIKLQKRAIRNVVGAKYNSHTEPIFKKLSLLKFSDIYKIQ